MKTFKEFLVEDWDVEIEDDIVCEEVWVDEDGEILDEETLYEAIAHLEGALFESEEDLFEAAKRAFRRMGSEIKRQFRCVGGPKDGKLVADAKSCMQRKDPKRVRHGRKVARTRKGIRIRKTQVTKRQATSRMVTRMNQRLSGKKPKPMQPQK